MVQTLYPRMKVSLPGRAMTYVSNNSNAPSRESLLAANMAPEAHKKRMQGLYKGWHIKSQLRKGEKVVLKHAGTNKSRKRKRLRLLETVAKEAREIQEIARKNAAAAMKRMAQIASPAIRPWQLEDGREYFVMFAGQRAFRDLKFDSAMQQANRDARSREAGGYKDNPIFQDGDLIYDGVIIRQVEEISTKLTTSATFATAGTSSNPVEPCFLCGQGAMGIAWGQEPTPRIGLTQDYQFRPGVAIEELRGLAKLSFPTGTAAAGKQHGVVTVYASGASD